MGRLGSVVGLLAGLWLTGSVRADDWALRRPSAPRGARVVSAEGGAERTLSSRPDDTAALERLIGEAEREPGGVGRMVERWAERQRARPDDAALAEVTVRLLARVGQTERALALLPAFAAKEGGCPGRLLLLGARLHREAGRATQAVELQRRVARCDQRTAARAEARRELLDTLLETGALQEARAEFETLGLPARGWPDALRAHGLHAEAAQALIALGTRSHDVSLWREAVRALLAAGDAEQALALSRQRQVGSVELEEQALRQLGKLAELATRLDGSGRAADRREAARLWDELGDDARAEQSLRAWLVASPRDGKALRSLAELLVRAGRRDEAQQVYRTLAQANPNDPEVLAGHVQLLRSAGRDDEALALLHRASSSRAPGVQLKVSDLLGSMGQTDQRRALLQRLIRLEPGQPDHVVALGELELAEGDREAALRIWRGLAARSGSRAQGLITLADVLGDHGLVDEALATLEQAIAIESDKLSLRRKHAGLLERTGQGPAAETAWLSVLRHPAADAESQREARAHLVSLWKRLGAVPMRARMLAERARGGAEPNATGPSGAEARRLLAEIFARDPQRAENELELVDRLASASADDAEVLRALAALHVRRDDLGRARKLLERLAELAPESAVDNLGRAVELSLAHYLDDDALHYAERAVVLRPDAPEAHLLLARVLTRRGERTAAVAAYRQVLTLKPTAFDTALQLAELLAAGKEFDAAATLWLDVLARSADDEQVRGVAQRLFELPSSVLAGRLEQTLTAAQQAQPARALYRQLLIGWYARSGVAAPALRALLETLDDPDPALRATAVRLLVSTRASGAALPLLLRVERTSARREATALLVAVGELGDPAVVAPLEALLPRLDPKLLPAALWALSSLSRERAVEQGRSRVRDDDASVRVMAHLVVGAGHGSSAQVVRELLVEEPHPAARAALLWALGQLAGERQDALLHAALRAPWPEGCAALAGLRADRSLLARTMLGIDAAQRACAARLWGASSELVLPPPNWPFEARAYVASVLGGAAPPPALDAEDGRLIGGALASLRDPSEAAGALAALDADGTGVVPRALVELGACPTRAFTDAFWTAAEARVAQLAELPGLRLSALRLLVRGGRAASPALVGVWSDERDPALGVLLADLAELPVLPAAMRKALLAAFERSRDWPTRLALARLIGGDVGEARRDKEPVALVRRALEASAPPPRRALCRVPAALN